MNYGRIFISSGVAFFMAILVAILIETFGGAIGSVIGTLPSTVIPAAYIFITEKSKTVDERVESVMSCLYGMIPTDLLFLPSWRVIPPRLPKKWTNGLKVFVTSVLSLALWLAGTVFIILLKSLFTQWGMSIWAFALGALVFTALCGAAICWTLPPTPPGKNKIGAHIHLIRGLAAATAIFISGVLSQTNLGVIAGAMVTFPSIFIATLVSVSLTQGPEVATGAVGPMTLGGQSYGWYSVWCAFFFAIAGFHPIWCCVLSFFMAGCFWSIPVFYFVRWRRDMTELKTQRMVSEAASEKEAIEMKSAKPVEANPNDAVLLNQDSIIPTEEAILEAERVGDAPLQEEKVGDAPLQEEKVTVPSQGIASEVVLADGVTGSIDLEMNA